MPRFSIRPYRPGDVDEVYGAANESRDHIPAWMGWLTPDYTRDSAESWVNHAISDWGITSYEHLIIDEEGAVAGSCGLNFINRSNRFCNLAYWVRASRLREGAARSATLLIRDFAFGSTDLERLEIVVAVGNEPSRKVAESVGATYEGILRRRLRVGEVSHDSHMFSLIREDL